MSARVTQWTKAPSWRAWTCSLVFLAAACGGADLKGAGEECVASSECADGLTCDFGRVPPTCQPQQTPTPDAAPGAPDAPPAPAVDAAPGTPDAPPPPPPDAMPPPPPDAMPPPPDAAVADAAMI